MAENVRGGLQAIPRGKPGWQCLGTEYAISAFVHCSAASAAGGHPSTCRLLGYLKILPVAVWLVGVDRNCQFWRSLSS